MRTKIFISGLLVFFCGCGQKPEFKNVAGYDSRNEDAVLYREAGPCTNSSISVNSLVGDCNAVPVNLPEFVSGQNYTATAQSDPAQGVYPTYLYAGQNDVPVYHRQRADSAAALIQPINGFIDVVCEGMSNSGIVFDGMINVVNASSLDNAQVRFTNLSEGGCDLVCWAGKGVGTVDTKVQVALLYHSNNKPQNGSCASNKKFPGHANATLSQLKTRVTQIRQKYPNLKLIYFGSREFGGWSCPPSNTKYQEPVAFEESFSVKWLIDKQVSGSDPSLSYANTPPMLWGPYTWNSDTPRNYFRADGGHPCNTGQAAFGQQWFDFLLSDPTARIWFAANP